MDLIFAVMPFADVGRPAMGVSLLAAAAREQGYSTSVEYFNINLAERMELALYQKIASSFPPDMLVGEWFFADDIFGDEIPEPSEYIERIFARVFDPNDGTIRKILDAKQLCAAYLDVCACTILDAKPNVVGFTTTFHQTCACLAVARRLKAAANPPIVIFGGANCEGEMGLQMMRSFEWIDFVCCGESDRSFLHLLSQLLGRQPHEPIPGVVSRGKLDAVARSEAVRDMNALPFPHFDDYFKQLSTSKLAGQFESHLAVETSRGCWWGAKHHCTFCGLNGDTMAFRSKSPERAYDEILFLANRHRTNRIGCVDNILDMRYIDTLFPRLAASAVVLEMFYEVKANLRYEQLVKMRDGGLRQIQPGIESFSNEVLRLMEKGCTGFQNIQLMRWCEELGIEVAWNLLAGFPRETAAEYERMAGLIPLLTHLTPPYSCARIRLDRFSPFHSHPERFGFHRMRPARAYYYVFPFGRQELNRIAYYFDFDYDDNRDPQGYLYPVTREVEKWWSSRVQAPDERARLDAHFEDGNVLIQDTRPAAISLRHEFGGLAAEVYARCDVAARPEKLAADIGVAEFEILAALDDLCSRRLMAEDDGAYLSLAVFRTRRPVRATEGISVNATFSKAAPAESLLSLV